MSESDIKNKQIISVQSDTFQLNKNIKDSAQKLLRAIDTG